MDRLDKLTAILVMVLSCYAAILLVTANGQSQAQEAGQRIREARAYSLTPELENKIRAARDLLAMESLDKGEQLLNDLLVQFPFEGELYMLKGDILLRRQQPIAAMYAYKEAIGFNPDFLDKKTSRFQGRKIKNTVEEALTVIEAGLQEKPDDRRLRDDQKMVYYMKRKLAGSCG